MLPTLFRTLPVLAVSCLLAGNSHAADISTAHAAVSNVQFTVFDRTPNDGQAAGLELKSVYSTISSRYFGSPILEDTRDVYGLQSVHTQLDTSTSHAAADTRGHVGEATAESSAGSGFSSWASSESLFISDAYYWLQPHSGFTVTAHASASIWAVPDVGDGYASVGFTLWTPENGGHSIGYYDKTLVIRWHGPDRSFSDDISMSYTNDTDQAIEIQLHSAMSTSSYSISPVPEPGGYAMLGAGLLLLGAVARRRKSA